MRNVKMKITDTDIKDIKSDLKNSNIPLKAYYYVVYARDEKEADFIIHNNVYAKRGELK